MGKTIIGILFSTILSGVANAQVSVQLNCSKLSVPFTANFSNQFVIIQMKGWSQKVPYRYGHVSRDGERFSVYQNPEIRVITTYPADNYVSIRITNGDEITGGHCLIN